MKSSVYRMKELAFRANDGVEVTLLRSRTDGRLAVIVEDSKNEESFELAATAENALDVFHHPYAYAAARKIEFADAA
jgi:hypothetical protein